MQTTILDKVPAKYTYVNGRRKYIGEPACSFKGANCERTPKAGQRVCRPCHAEYMGKWRADERTRRVAERNELAELRAMAGR
jgi:hypothetical protein